RPLPCPAVLRHPHAAELQRHLQRRSQESRPHRKELDLGVQPWRRGGIGRRGLTGPLIAPRYGRPIVIRRFNELSFDTRGFGVPEVSTHTHNWHAGPDSDGGPCDPTTGADSTNPFKQGRFFFIGQFYDYFETMARA